MSGLEDTLLLEDFFFYESSLLPTWALQGRAGLRRVHSQVQRGRQSHTGHYLW